MEHEIRDLLRAAGYSVVRGAGSKGELDLGSPMRVDLVATKMTGQLEREIFIVGLQCKLRRRRSNRNA